MPPDRLAWARTRRALLKANQREEVLSVRVKEHTAPGDPKDPDKKKKKGTGNPGRRPSMWRHVTWVGFTAPNSRRIAQRLDRAATMASLTLGPALLLLPPALEQSPNYSPLLPPYI